MTIAYLIDTDWVIPYLNGHPAIVERLEELQEAGLALSVISLAELYEGIYYSRDPDRNEQALNNFLRGVMVIGIDEDICRIFGRERSRLRAAGKLHVCSRPITNTFSLVHLVHKRPRVL
jgi:tRNA(fMet)-specific endonuclease VapC